MTEVQTRLRGMTPRAAQMAAVEILLAHPDALDDGVLESSLYILREKLQGKPQDDS